MSREPSVEFQLGALNVNWDRVVRMKSDLFDRAALMLDRAALMHCMGAEVKADIISDTAKETGYRLCYNAGIDGSDARYWIEPIPHHHVDWDMSEAEWEELRHVLWYNVNPGPYVTALREAGKLGHMPLPKIQAPNWVQAGGGGGGGESVSFQPGGFSPTGRTPRPPQPQPLGRLRPNRYGPPMPVSHEKQYPVDAQEDTWRCGGCGYIYKVAVGFAICPNDPSPPTGSKVGGGPTIP